MIKQVEKWINQTLKMGLVAILVVLYSRKNFFRQIFLSFFCILAIREIDKIKSEEVLGIKNEIFHLHPL